MNRMLLVFLLLGAMLLAGCGTSNLSAEEETILDPDWEDLLVTSEEESAEPSIDTIMPSLEESAGYAESEDVTGSYQSTVLGTWDNEAGTLVYEFLSNENLYITDSSGNSINYSYWFTETENQVLLHIFQNGQAEADRYSFTLSGSTLTLFDADTGSTAERLIRRAVTEEETIAAPTQTPSSSSSSAASEPAAAAVESSPESASTPSPDSEEVPSSAQTSSAAESTPAPTASADEPASEEAQEDSDEVTLSELLPSDTTGLSEDALQALPAITCALDAIREGGQFSVEDADSFWAILARYASQGGYPDEDGYYILTPEEAFACASEIFADLEELPECPEDSIIAIHETEGSSERYLVLQGELSGVDIVSVTENSDGSLTVSVRDDSNAYDYLVVLDGSAIVSISLD